MLKIRLLRIGKRGQAYFKVVVTEHTVKPQGKYLELLGSYDPHKNKLTVDANKIKHWLDQGAKMSETVNNLVINRGIIEGDKVKTWNPKKKGAPATITSEIKTETTPSKEAPVTETTSKITTEQEIPDAIENTTVTP